MRFVPALFIGLILVTTALFGVVASSSGFLIAVDVFLTAKPPSAVRPVWGSIPLGFSGQLLVPAVAGAAAGYAYQVASDANADERTSRLIGKFAGEFSNLSGPDLNFELAEIKRRYGPDVASQVRKVIERQEKM